MSKVKNPGFGGFVAGAIIGSIIVGVATAIVNQQLNACTSSYEQQHPGQAVGSNCSSSLAPVYVAGVGGVILSYMLQGEGGAIGAVLAEGLIGLGYYLVGGLSL